MKKTREVPLSAEVDRFCALIAERGDLVAAAAYKASFSRAASWPDARAHDAAWTLLNRPPVKTRVANLRRGRKADALEIR